jgi:dolichyl-phosphate-mannose-protein mannosyltransferase
MYSICLELAVLIFLYLDDSFQNGTGDANDVWRVLIVGGAEGDLLTTVTSKLRFVHVLQHCALTTSTKQLPKW